jgi:hypothetical protein
MKLNYDLIRENIKIYESAKKAFPVIPQYEKGDVDKSAMNSLGLVNFANFSDFIRNLNSIEFTPIMGGMTWRKLKPLLVKHTTNERFKTYLNNRTEKQFQRLLIEFDDFDKLLNGRWARKPNPDSRTRKGRNGRRDSNRAEGLQVCIVPIINYIIQSDIEINDHHKLQERINQSINWFTGNFKLNSSEIPATEVEVTSKLLELLAGVIEDNKIDFRKLNLNYISNAIHKKLSNLMVVPAGTRLKCISDTLGNCGNKVLTKDTYYDVKDCRLIGGALMVYVSDDRGISQYCPYRNFEDVAMRRDDLLSSLLGE